MLTVLWRHPNGAEEIFSCDRLVRLCATDPTGQREEESVPARGPFMAHGVTRTDSPAEDYYQFSIAGPFGAVFVMNDKGRTVASYFAEPHLKASAPGHTRRDDETR